MKTLPAYESPTVETYTDAELLAALGPAQANSSGGCFGQVGPGGDCEEPGGPPPE